MNTHIKATAVTMTPILSDYINKRLQKIEQHFGDASMQCDVELGRSTAHHQKGEVFRAEIHLVGNGYNVFAQSKKEDLHAAIDDACDEALRSLSSRRKKYISMVRRGGAMMKNMMKGMWPWKGK